MLTSVGYLIVTQYHYIHVDRPTHPRQVSKFFSTWFLHAELPIAHHVTDCYLVFHQLVPFHLVLPKCINESRPSAVQCSAM